MKRVLFIAFIGLIFASLFGCYEKGDKNNMLTADEIRQVKNIQLFMPDDVWDIVRKHNIYFGRQEVKDELTYADLERDEETQSASSSSGRYYKLNSNYSIRLFTIITDIEPDEIYLEITSVDLLNKNTQVMISIPEKLFPYVIAEKALPE